MTDTERAQVGHERAHVVEAHLRAELQPVRCAQLGHYFAGSTRLSSVTERALMSIGSRAPTVSEPGSASGSSVLSSSAQDFPKRRPGIKNVMSS